MNRRAPGSFTVVVCCWLALAACSKEKGAGTPADRDTGDTADELDAGDELDEAVEGADELDDGADDAEPDTDDADADPEGDDAPDADDGEPDAPDVDDTSDADDAPDADDAVDPDDAEGTEPERERELVENPLPGAGPFTVGPDGGTFDRGPARLTVPAGAVAAPVDITIELAGDRPPAAGTVPVTPIVRLSPPGLTFARPVRLSLPVDERRIAGFSPRPALQGFSTARDDESTWEAPVAATEADGRVAFDLTHFSFAYGGFPVPAGACRDDGDCAAGAICHLLPGGRACAPPCSAPGRSTAEADQVCAGTAAGTICHPASGGRCAPSCRTPPAGLTAAGLCAELGIDRTCAPDGRCAAPREGACAADGDCPSGSVCHRAVGAGVCAPACEPGPQSDVVCGRVRAGARCIEGADGGRCVPRCGADADCRTLGDAFVCGNDALCVPRPGGNACTSSADCRSGEACHRLDPQQRGRCGTSCVVGEPARRGDAYCTEVAGGGGCDDRDGACRPACGETVSCDGIGLAGGVCTGGRCVLPGECARPIAVERASLPFVTDLDAPIWFEVPGTIDPAIDGLPAGVCGGSPARDRTFGFDFEPGDLIEFRALSLVPGVPDPTVSWRTGCGAGDRCGPRGSRGTVAVDAAGPFIATVETASTLMRSFVLRLRRVAAAPECTGDGRCTLAGQVCHRNFDRCDTPGACTPACLDDCRNKADGAAFCATRVRADTVCLRSGLCGPAPLTCTGDADCAVGDLCTTGAGGGACAPPCGSEPVPCAFSGITDAVCGRDGRCRARGFDCNADEQCATGAVCHTDLDLDGNGTFGTCAPACTTGDGGAAGSDYCTNLRPETVCTRTTGRCAVSCLNFPVTPPPGGTSRNDYCAGRVPGSVCVETTGPGGRPEAGECAVVRTPCVTPAQCDLTGSVAEACDPTATDDLGGFGRCVDSCILKSPFNDRACGAGTVCHPEAAGGVCLAPCTEGFTGPGGFVRGDAACAVAQPGSVCDTASGRCVIANRPAPADACDGADRGPVIDALPFYDSFDIGSGYRGDFAPGCSGETGAGGTGIDAVYKLVVDRAAVIRADLWSESGFDAMLFVKSQCSTGSAGCIAGVDGPTGDAVESLTVTLPRAGTYYLYVDTYSSSGRAGRYSLVVRRVPGCADGSRPCTGAGDVCHAGIGAGLCGPNCSVGADGLTGDTYCDDFSTDSVCHAAVGSLCAPPCTDNASCGLLQAGSVCLRSGRCVPPDQRPTACTATSGCGSDDICHRSVNAGVCAPACTTGAGGLTGNAFCAQVTGDPAFLCLASGECARRPDRCTAAAQCPADEVCHTALAGTGGAGVCAPACAAAGGDAACAALQNGAVCTNAGRCVPQAQTNTCRDDAGCRPGTVCHVTATATNGLCAPACTTGAGGGGGDAFCAGLGAGLVCHTLARGGLCAPSCVGADGRVPLPDPCDSIDRALTCNLDGDFAGRCTLPLRPRCDGGRTCPAGLVCHADVPHNAGPGNGACGVDCTVGDGLIVDTAYCVSLAGGASATGLTCMPEAGGVCRTGCTTGAGGLTGDAYCETIRAGSRCDVAGDECRVQPQPADDCSGPFSPVTTFPFVLSGSTAGARADVIDFGLSCIGFFDDPGADRVIPVDVPGPGVYGIDLWSAGDFAVALTTSCDADCLGFLNNTTRGAESATFSAPAAGRYWLWVTSMDGATDFTLRIDRRDCGVDGDCRAGVCHRSPGDARGLCAPACAAAGGDGFCETAVPGSLCDTSLDRCIRPCAGDAYCAGVAAGTVCLGDGRCVPPGQVPAACAGDTDCRTGLRCHRPAGGVTGTCAADCRRGAGGRLGDAFCAGIAAGSQCGSTGLCAPPVGNCVDSAECGIGRLCHDGAGSQGVCAPPCDIGAGGYVGDDFCDDVGPGLTCLRNGLCAAAPSRCSTAEECPAGAICTRTARGRECVPSCNGQSADFCTRVLGRAPGTLCHNNIDGGACAPDCRTGDGTRTGDAYCDTFATGYKCGSDGRCDAPGPFVPCNNGRCAGGICHAAVPDRAGGVGVCAPSCTDPSLTEPGDAACLAVGTSYVCHPEAGGACAPRCQDGADGRKGDAYCRAVNPRLVCDRASGRCADGLTGGLSCNDAPIVGPEMLPFTDEGDTRLSTATFDDLGCARGWDGGRTRVYGLRTGRAGEVYRIRLDGRGAGFDTQLAVSRENAPCGAAGSCLSGFDVSGAEVVELTATGAGVYWLYVGESTFDPPGDGGRYVLSIDRIDCAADTECDPGLICHTATGRTRGICGPPCAGDATAQAAVCNGLNLQGLPSLVCHPDTGGGQCAPACTGVVNGESGAAVCGRLFGSGSFCTSTGDCRPASAVPALCAADRDCAPGTVCHAEVGGACRPDCATGADGYTGTAYCRTLGADLVCRRTNRCGPRKANCTADEQCTAAEFCHATVDLSSPGVLPGDPGVGDGVPGVCAADCRTGIDIVVDGRRRRISGNAMCDAIAEGSVCQTGAVDAVGFGACAPSCVRGVTVGGRPVTGDAFCDRLAPGKAYRCETNAQSPELGLCVPPPGQQCGGPRVLSLGTDGAAETRDSFAGRAATLASAVCSGADGTDPTVWFAVDLAPGAYSVTADQQAASVSMRVFSLGTYTCTGSSTCRSASFSSTGAPSRLTLVVEAAGRGVFAVQRTSGTPAAGVSEAFRFRIERLPESGSPGTCAEARTLTRDANGAATVSPLVIGPSNGVSLPPTACASARQNSAAAWFKVTLGAGERITVTVDQPPDVVVHVFQLASCTDTAGGACTGVDDTAGSSSPTVLNYTAAAAGEYYINVRPYSTDLSALPITTALRIARAAR